MVYIGIDPGASGGLAFWDNGRITAMFMPATERDAWTWISKSTIEAFAVIEKVGGYVPNARGGQPGSAMFKFGQSYGGLRMALIAADIPFEEVAPQRWQKAMGIAPKDRKGGESASAFKRRLKAKAQQLFPKVNVTLATADALLIMEYCRRLQLGKL